MQIGIIILTCATFALIWFLLADYGQKKAYWLICIAIVINGTINIGIYSSCFEYAVSLNDYGESLSAGCINCLANTLGFVQIVVFQYIVGVKNDTKSELSAAMYIFFTGCVISFIL
jgi:hypothetical protein